MAALDFIPLGDFEITYLDGTKETARSNFGAILDLEAEYAGNDEVQRATMTLKALWLYLGQPKDSLRSWASNVHNFEPVGNATADPTPPTAGDG
jgi:hypothetical protein